MDGNGRTLTCEVRFEDGEGNLMGTGVVSYKSAYSWRPGCAVFVCPHCGEVWGKTVVDGVWEKHFSALSAGCKKHGGGTFTSTAMQLEYKSFDIVYGQDVLKHDFVVMYDFWEELKEEGLYGGSTIGNLPIAPGCNQSRCRESVL